MRQIAALLSLLVLFGFGPNLAQAADVDEAAVNAAAKALDDAFASGNAAEIKKLMTADHVSVTPYYDGPQTTDQQIASLPELKWTEIIEGTVKVSALGPDAAMRNFISKMDGTFKGKTLPSRAYVTEILVKQDGAWVERFYQVTTLAE
jgi:uncharacterized protein (TIGR02246 family)